MGNVYSRAADLDWERKKKDAAAKRSNEPSFGAWSLQQSLGNRATADLLDKHVAPKDGEGEKTIEKRTVPPPIVDPALWQKAMEDKKPADQPAAAEEKKEDGKGFEGQSQAAFATDVLSTDPRESKFITRGEVVFPATLHRGKLSFVGPLKLTAEGSAISDKPASLYKPESGSLKFGIDWSMINYAVDLLKLKLGPIIETELKLGKGTGLSTLGGLKASMELERESRRFGPARKLTFFGKASAAASGTVNSEGAGEFKTESSGEGGFKATLNPKLSISIGVKFAIESSWVAQKGKMTLEFFNFSLNF